MNEITGVYKVNRMITIEFFCQEPVASVSHHGTLPASPSTPKCYTAKAWSPTWADECSPTIYESSQLRWTFSFDQSNHGLCFDSLPLPRGRKQPWPLREFLNGQSQRGRCGDRSTHLNFSVQSTFECSKEKPKKNA